MPAPFSVFFAMGAFALAMAISPGPVNMVIVASGAHHGFSRTLPFVGGATVGFTLLLLLVGMAMQGSLDAGSPWLTGLALAGSAFIAYVGYGIASAPPELALKAAEQLPPAFGRGLLLQWLNPKAWIASASGVSLFADPTQWTTLGLFASIYTVVCFVSLSAWAAMGDRLSSVLAHPQRMRAFNTAMGGLLMATALHMAITQLLR